MINPELYNTIIHRLGATTIVREGEPAVYAKVASPYSVAGKQRLMIKLSDAGEEYRCNCPFCGDTGGHLYINHLYGVVDSSGLRFPLLAHCHHGCLDSKDKRIKLESMLLGLAGRRKSFKLKPTLFIKPVKVAPPEPVAEAIGVQLLSQEHPAIRYLCESRQFDLDVLEKYRVGYCPCSEKWPHINNHIVIPIYYKGVFYGWQARYIGVPPEGTPKYYIQPGLKKSACIYGYDAAVDSKYYIITEGVTDVWRLGPGAVCGFGKYLSTTQTKELLSSGKPLVVCFDPDAESEATKLSGILSKSSSAPVLQVLYNSDACDPGDMSYSTVAELQRMIEEILNGEKNVLGSSASPIRRVCKV